MRILTPLVLVPLFAATLYAEVFDLGKLKDYEPKTDKVPDGIEPDSIYIIQEDGGFNVLLGKDVKAEVDGAIKACDKMDNKCFETINGILTNAHVQIDHTLEPRQAMVAAVAIGGAFRTVTKVIAGISAFAMAISALSGKQLYNEKGSHWSDLAAENVAKIPEGKPITISADNKAVATVTQAAIETTLEGSTKPIVTEVKSDSDGFTKGDLAGILDADLAARLDEFMHRRTDCLLGIEFDKEHPPKKRAPGTYGQALCAAQGVMQGATANGPFNDLVLLDPAGINFGFAAGAAQDAANKLAEFITTYAPLIDLSDERFLRIGVFVLALAIDSVVDNVTLGEQNRIKATMVTTTDSPSSTATGCPKAEDLSCGVKEKEDCPAKLVGEGDKKKSVCEKGKHKDCECTLPGQYFMNYANEERQKFLKGLNDLLGDGGDSEDSKPEKKKAECSDKKKTVVPSSIFGSVYGHFCDGWPQGNDMSMTVDSKGSDIERRSHLRKRVVVSADAYKNFDFELGFLKGEGSGKCSMDCNKAFDEMSKACVSSPENKVLPLLVPGIGSNMYEEGSLDVGCGKFTYKILERDEIAKLEEYPRVCYKEDDFEPLTKGKPNKKTIRKHAKNACWAEGREQVIKKDDKITFVHYVPEDDNIPYQFNVWWKDKCTLGNNGPSEVEWSNPLMEKNPNRFLCYGKLFQNWSKCPNGGVGGTVQIGCLIYEFKADKNARTW